MHNSPTPIARSLLPSAFNILEEARGFIDALGEMDVAEGHEGYVIYGPYWSMASGKYIVEPEIVSALAGDLSCGVLEICDNGVILASAPLKAGVALSASLPAIAGLEIRIKAFGVPFRLVRVVVVHFPDTPLRLTTGEADDQRDRLTTLDGWLAQRHITQTVDGLITPSLSRRYDALAEIAQASAPLELVRRLSDNLTFGQDFDTWLDSREKAAVYDVWDDNLALNGDALLGMGFDLASVRLASSDSDELAALYAEQLGRADIAEALLTRARAEPPQIASQWLQQLHTVIGAFGRLTAALGCACVTCPFTGELLTSRHSLPIPQTASKQTYIFYRFESVTPFYVVSAGFPASKAFIYVPSRNVILRLHPPTFEWGSPQAGVKRFIELSIPHAVKVSEYLARQTTLAVLCGTMDNLGHSLWNEVSGLLEAEEAGLLPPDFTPLLAQHRFVDAFSLLEQHPAQGVIGLDEDLELFLLCLETSLFCVRLASAQVSDRTAARIYAGALVQSAPDQRKALSKALGCDYLLWAGLRSHNKVWIEQVRGIAGVVRDLLSRYKRVALFVDGTPDCASMLDELRRELPANVETYSGIDIPLSETILWSYNVDSYIATIGSGLVIPTWFAAKPGVAHSESHHLHQMSFWGDVRLSAPLPLTPSTADVTDQSAGGYCDYSISPSLMLDLFRRLPEPSGREISPRTHQPKLLEDRP